MVQNPRTTPRADHLRPLNPPRLLAVIVADGRPASIVHGSELIAIAEIQDCWAVDDEWWREPIRRRYYQIATDAGIVRTIYHDLVGDDWFEQRY